VRIVFLADAPHIHTRRWIEHCIAAGHDCDVISFRPAAIEGARVHYVDGAETLGKARYLLHARRVRGLIDDLAPDLLHALHLTSYGFIGALAGVHPYIVSVWGTDILEAPRLTPFHAWLTRYALAHADTLTATGLHLATETARLAPRHTPVTVIPYGVDLQRFAPETSPPQSHSPSAMDDQVVIGTVSRLSVEKGVRYLIEAFGALHTRLGERVRLRIAGEGPERRRIEALVRRLHLEAAVELLGEIEHDAVPAFLRGLDIFVMPSIYEGFGVAAVEASATGLPVVASNVHGIPDVVRDGKTGILVPAEDVPALVQALDKLIEDAALRRSLGRAGRDYVAARYDWRQNTRQMDLLYERVINPRRGEVAVWT
jgi:glycosyltransferase involved in cell wall biosynthesis